MYMFSCILGYRSNSRCGSVVMGAGVPIVVFSALVTALIQPTRFVVYTTFYQE